MIIALHASHRAKSQAGNLVLVCAFVCLHVHFVRVLIFVAVHIWCGLVLGPCWCTLMVLKTDPQHTHNTQPTAAQPLVRCTLTDGVLKAVLTLANIRKHEQSDKQGLLGSNA